MPQSLVRERSLTVLVIFEAIELFLIAPLSTTSGIPYVLISSLIAANVIAVLAVVWHIRPAIVAVGIASLLEVAAVILRALRPSAGTEALDFAAAFVLLVAVTTVLGIAVFGAGRVSIHRILGAVAIYLNVGAAFALAYRIIETLNPHSFTSTLGPAASAHSIADLVYFSFATLTTAGYGDIVPVSAFARSFANVESVIGQLFPATLLARLMTLHLEDRRDERRSG